MKNARGRHKATYSTNVQSGEAYLVREIVAGGRRRLLSPIRDYLNSRIAEAHCAYTHTRAHTHL